MTTPENPSKLTQVGKHSKAAWHWCLTPVRAVSESMQSDFPPHRFSNAKMAFTAATTTMIWATVKIVNWALGTPAPDPVAQASRLSFVFDVLMLLAVTFCATKVAGLALGRGAEVAKSWGQKGPSKTDPPNGATPPAADVPEPPRVD